MYGGCVDNCIYVVVVKYLKYKWCTVENYFKTLYQVLVDFINVGSENLKFMASSSEPWISRTKMSSGGEDPLSIAVKHREKRAFQGSLATSKLVSKNKEHNRWNGHKANGLTPVVLLPAIRHLVWPAPDPPTTFFDISKSKIILWSKLLQLRFEMYFFWKGRLFLEKGPSSQENLHAYLYSPSSLWCLR